MFEEDNPLMVIRISPIVAYGENCADNHHMGDDTLIQPGDSIIIDMGCYLMVIRISHSKTYLPQYTHHL